MRSSFCTKAIVAATTLALLVSCNEGEYKNLAHFRAAYQSSCADFDQAAQLITDGIISTEMPDMATSFINGKPVPAYNKEWPLDWCKWSSFAVGEKECEYVVNSGSAEIAADGVTVVIQIDREDATGPLPYKFEVYASEDGENWNLVGSANGVDYRYRDSSRYSTVEENISFGKALSYKSIKLVADCSGATVHKLLSFIQKLNGEDLYVLDKTKFNSAWVSATGENEWVYVDLGERSCLKEMVFYWLNRPTSGRVLLSDDAETWVKVCDLTDSDTLEVFGHGRYVKVEMDKTEDGNPFVLSELQVFGRNTLERAASDWMVCREDSVDDPDAWLPANVPGTVLSSYIDAGVVPDITVADNNHCVSQSYFRSNFIYKGKMVAPETKGEKVWLNFDGINWKADVKLNGVELGHIAGAFTSARFDVTDIIMDGENDVEVKIYCNNHPGIGRMNTREREAYNGGVLGADNPTFHSSIGWDWMPSLAGRNIGIWNDVYFSTTGVVTIEEPHVVTYLNLPDTTMATINASAVLRNHSDQPATAIVDFNFGTSCCSMSIEVPANGEASYVHEYKLANPKLWWPNGYGEQNLYDASFTATVDGLVSDADSFKVGVRQMTYDTSDGSLKIYVNGRRFVARGGNWGFSEVNLRYRAKDYDNAVAYHAQQNFTMIRNWVGQTGDEEFYEACDKYGIMVWQDFWLANPSDGPNPMYEDMFMQNAYNYVRRIRNHASIALYCGRNEGYPPASINEGLAELVANLTDLYYIPHSAEGLVSGYGGYWRMSAEDFFKMRGNDKLHSERGMPNIMNYESLINFVPAEKAWPIGQLWAEHDWAKEGAMRSEEFASAIETMFGEIDSAEKYCKLAQWVNYDGYRAMFEGRSLNRRGLLLWMSHPAWPSLVWSTYDYYLDPTAAFFGAKKACEPLHVQWNPVTRKVEVVNISAGDREGLVVVSRILDINGKLISENRNWIGSAEDTTMEIVRLNAPADADVYYISLSLEEDQTGVVLSKNFYVLGAETDNFQALNSLKKAKVSVSTKVEEDGDDYVMTVSLDNGSKAPALMLHLVPRSAGKRVLPYNADDNYIHLMPGEKRTVRIRMEKAYCHGSKPTVALEGFNI